MDYKKACMMLAVLALLFALVAFSFANNINDNVNIFQVVVNNTNLAPAVIDHPGTGERITGVTYFANASPIQLLVFAHANTISQTATVEVNINGTVVANQSGRPLAGAEDSHRTVIVVVPKYSSYVVNFSNYHHYEWREYPILSGRNGTLSVNQTFITNITNTFNATYDQTTKEFNSNYTAQTFPNSTIITNSNNMAALQKNDSYFNGTVYPQSTNFRNDSINDTVIRNYTAHIKVGSFTRDISLATGTQVITGVGFKPSGVIFFAVLPSTSEASWGMDDGVTSTSSVLFPTSLVTNDGTAAINIFDGVSKDYGGKVQSFDSDGFTISWTKTGLPTGTATIRYMAFR